MRHSMFHGRGHLLAGLILLSSALLPSGAGAQQPEGPGDPFRHLEALQEIATANGGHRAAGSAGYDRSVDYVAEQLRRAGYEVRLEEFTFPFFEERTPPVLRSGPPGTPEAAAPREALRTLMNSGSGRVTARLQPVDIDLPAPGAVANAATPSTSGCEPADFTGFEAGAIALLLRGTCPFQQKIENATAAGAAGAVIMNQGTEGQTGVFAGNLGRPARIPVLAVSTELGRALDEASRRPEGLEVHLAIDVEQGERTTRNVIADRAGSGTDLIVAGAHLDSVQAGPGMNDNGSGTAAVLEAALRMSREPAGERSIRFTFWGAEERGLVGSRHHLTVLAEEERRRIALYINLDMVGSPNFGRFVRSIEPGQEGLATAARRTLLGFFRERSLPTEERAGAGRRGFGSDDASFAEKSIPTISLYTGAGEPKSEGQAALFGGSAGRPLDPCYHQACDTAANIDRPVLAQMTDALTHVLRDLLRSPPASEETSPAKGPDEAR